MAVFFNERAFNVKRDEDAAQALTGAPLEFAGHR
jgi:hypothetical protein